MAARLGFRVRMEEGTSGEANIVDGAITDDDGPKNRRRRVGKFTNGGNDTWQEMGRRQGQARKEKRGTGEKESVARGSR